MHQRIHKSPLKVKIRPNSPRQRTNSNRTSLDRATITANDENHHITPYPTSPLPASGSVDTTQRSTEPSLRRNNRTTSEFKAPAKDSKLDQRMRIAFIKRKATDAGGSVQLPLPGARPLNPNPKVKLFHPSETGEKKRIFKSKKTTTIRVERGLPGVNPITGNPPPSVMKQHNRKVAKAKAKMHVLVNSPRKNQGASGGAGPSNESNPRPIFPFR